ncbi:hypothetical protein AAFF_G00123640 [Aldrovandia affinis]|uniref:Uncharacterized protein n=1 Tax=Aldrovandia affinis TaxID=143900 RepID=A0AAD7WA57_9TELE|nr:hypothetical protein AAFF_G00123640 [Aldrovandia affinis]
MELCPLPAACPPLPRSEDPLCPLCPHVQMPRQLPRIQIQIQGDAEASGPQGGSNPQREGLELTVRRLRHSLMRGAVTWNNPGLEKSLRLREISLTHEE